ncbi:MAG: Ohr family peroxiredoxin [Alphaproteobacteria bacterium]|nr:Ohr family peroxiredoxin [Alphaproteobacteria bacterium]
MPVLYTANATVTGGRDGHGETDDKRLSVDLSRPDSTRPGTNPEQLFACGYAACFGSAVQFVAGQQKLETGPIGVQAEVTLNQDESGFFIGATLNVSLSVLEQEEAEDLVRTAHQVCPYSKATRGNVKVALKVNGKPIDA